MILHCMLITCKQSNASSKLSKSVHIEATKCRCNNSNTMEARNGSQQLNLAALTDHSNSSETCLKLIAQVQNIHALEQVYGAIGLGLAMEFI